MDPQTKQNIAEDVRRLMAKDYHCSEATLLVVGKYYLSEVDPLAVRMSTPFAAGVGCTHLELCGALAGGLMLIGALYGREKGDVNDDQCQALSAKWRERFLQEFGYIRCQDLRDNWVGQPGQPDCKALTAHASGLLFDFLEAEK
jgi:C_GCAxxG_C_C family probable redox protein